MLVRCLPPCLPQNRLAWQRETIELLEHAFPRRKSQELSL